MFERKQTGTDNLPAHSRKTEPREGSDHLISSKEAQALDALAVALQGALAPVKPAPSFRCELGRELAAAARQKKSPRVILQRPRNYRRDLLIGAAVSSAVSVAGLIAFIWHHRARESAQRMA